MKTKHSNFANLSIAFACFLVLNINPAQAKLVEEIIKVPVKASNSYGKASEQDIVVTLFYDDTAAKPYPLAIINHGRSVKPEERAAFGRATSITNARWLTRMGFLVAVPTRMGYGVSGGEDVEDSGNNCFNKNYPPGYEAAASQTLQILQTLRSRPSLAPDRAIVLGVSYGGTTAVTVAAKSPPGVQAALNFAGGGGGNPITQAQQPCSPNRLKDMFANYGTTSRMPMLWVYAEDDAYFGPKYPREWFDAFKDKGGVGEFMQVPPTGKDGHGLFSNAPDIWRPKALEFLKANGYPELKEPEVSK